MATDTIAGIAKLSRPHTTVNGSEVQLTAYAPTSSLGWLDFDAAAADRVARLLRALQEPSTLDVLGLGSVVTTFSDMLHPGTSYVHTRLRYLIFLPWIFQRLEADEVAPGDFSRRLRDDEVLLIDCLRHQGSGQGVIGYQAGRNLKRMPSDIYWGALWDWGLRRLPLGLGEYAQRAAGFGRYRAGRDDDGNATDETHSMWAALPPPPSDFLHAKIDFELTLEEAEALVENIRRSRPKTLMASLCAKPDAASQYTYPWDINPSTLPESAAEVLRHARCFSELTAGPQYAYNILVARRAQRLLRWDTEELITGQLRHLQSWVSLVKVRNVELRAWVSDLPAFWELLRQNRRSPIRHGTQHFVNTIVKLAVNDPEGFDNHEDLRQVIRRREIRLKSNRARLGSRAALENWHGSAVGGQHTYRWSVAKRYLGEIAEALRAGA